MQMDISQVFGLGFAIIALAVVAVAVINGGSTAQIINAAGGSFVDAINAATHPGGSSSGGGTSKRGM